MIKKPNYYYQIIQTLNRLYKSHPSYSIGRHISTASDGSNLWGVSDKEFLHALHKYELSLEIDINHDEDVEDIIKGGMNLETLFSNDEEEEY